MDTRLKRIATSSIWDTAPSYVCVHPSSLSLLPPGEGGGGGEVFCLRTQKKAALIEPRVTPSFLGNSLW